LLVSKTDVSFALFALRAACGESAQNRGMMPSVIGGSIGGVRAIEQTLQQRSKLGFWDAMIVEAAHQLGCTTLWAEDLTDNQLLQGVRVRNPFQ